MNQRIVIIGAGFAGLWSALAARRRLQLELKESDDIEIVVVAPEPALTMRPRLYEASPADMVTPLMKLFDDTHIKYVSGRVDKIRSGVDEIDVINHAGERTSMRYDRLILAAGSSVSHSEIPNLSLHTFNTDQRTDAIALDLHLHALASKPDSPERNTVLVVGGGFTGIEVAAEMPGRLRPILGHDATIKVIILELASVIGPNLGVGPRPVITQALSELGVESRLDTSVVQVDKDGVITSTGERIRSQTVIWTGGVRASSLTEQIPAPRDSLGRVRVSGDLRIASAPKIFAAGDSAVAATDDLGNYTLMSCQHAIFLGRTAGDNAVADLLGMPTNIYRQPSYATCLDLGAWGAVLTQGWDRSILLVGDEAKALKRKLNSEMIYPPMDAAKALAEAKPAVE